MGLIGTEHMQTMEFDYHTLYGTADQDFQQIIQPITKEEIQNTITQLPNNKALGPDGYTAEFYNEFKELLVPELQCVYRIAVAAQPGPIPIE